MPMTVNSFDEWLALSKLKQLSHEDLIKRLRRYTEACPCPACQGRKEVEKGEDLVKCKLCGGKGFLMLRSPEAREKVMEFLRKGKGMKKREKQRAILLAIYFHEVCSDISECCVAARWNEKKTLAPFKSDFSEKYPDIRV